MDDPAHGRREVDGYDVETACQKANWTEDRSWPRLLRVLSEIYSSTYLVKHEQEIKKKVQRYGKYHGSFDFTLYLDGELDNKSSSASLPSLKDKVLGLDPALNTDVRCESQMDQDLVGLSNAALISDPNEPPLPQMMQYDPAPDAFSMRTIFRMAEVCQTIS